MTLIFTATSLIIAYALRCWAFPYGKCSGASATASEAGPTADAAAAKATASASDAAHTSTSAANTTTAPDKPLTSINTTR